MLPLIIAICVLRQPKTLLAPTSGEELVGTHVTSPPALPLPRQVSQVTAQLLRDPPTAEPPPHLCKVAGLHTAAATAPGPAGRQWQRRRQSGGAG